MTTTMAKLSADTMLVLRKLVHEVKGSLDQSISKIKKTAKDVKRKKSGSRSAKGKGASAGIEVYAVDELALQSGAPVPKSMPKSPKAMPKSPRAVVPPSPRMEPASPRMEAKSPRVVVPPSPRMEPPSPRMEARTPRTLEQQEVPSAKQGYDVELEAKAYKLEVDLAACSAILGKLGNAVVPWDIKSHASKVTEAKAQFDRCRGSVKGLLTELVAEAHHTKQDAAKLEEMAKLVVTSRDQETALQKSFQIHSSKNVQIRAMLEKLAPERLAQKESRGAAGGRFATTGSDDILQMLSEEVDAMFSENQEAAQSNAALEKAKAELTRRVKELTDKMRDEMEIKDRELQRLRNALKRAGEDKETSMGAAKEEVTGQVAKKVAEIKNLQRRLEVAKTESEQAKAQSKALKASTEQALASMAQSQEEVKALTRRLQDARLQKDNTTRDLEQAKAEQNMIYAEMRELQASSPAPKSLSCYHAKEAGWPRIAYTQRGGKVLHNMGCGSVDTNKCVPFQYEDFTELEGYMQEEGFVMCHTCRADPGF